MKKTILLLVISVVLAGVVYGEGTSYFIKAVGGESHDLGYSVAQTNDGGYIVAGNSQSYGGLDSDVLIVKFDSNGGEQWTKTVGGDSSDAAKSVVQTSDGGYIITGQSSSYGGSDADVLIVKFDSNGVEQWTKTVGGDSGDYGNSVAQTSDGGYIVAGSSYSYGSDNQDLLIVKFDSDGVEQWLKVVAGPYVNYPELGYSVAQTNDGGYIVTGSSAKYSGGYADLLLVKVDSEGIEQWTTTVGGDNTDRGYSIAQTSDGGYIVTGTSQSYGGPDTDLLLVKFYSNGAEQWTKTIGGDSSDYGKSVAQTSDGGYVVIGYSQSYGGSDADVLIVKFDSNGIEQWTKTVGEDSSDYGYSVVQTSDGGYIITANSYNGIDYDFLLIRLDENGTGLSDCLAIADETVTEESHSVTALIHATTEQSYSVTEENHIVTEQSHDPVETIICVAAAGETIPTYSSFTSPETTNFSEETNLTDVTNLTLAIENKGKIQFADDYGINAENQDYDANIVIEDGSISIDTSALDSTFNNSATLTFYNIDCNSPLVYYSDTETTRYNILTEDNQCLAPRCTNIQCTGTTLTVDVLHFTGYAVSGSVNLTIDADDPKFVLEDVTFTAVYMNLTGGFIAGATCYISFPDGSYIMDEQADHYNYTKAFAAAQTVDYNVTCSKTGYNTVFANDTAIINDIPVPEFSLLTLGIGLIAVLAGLIIIRKKR